MNMPARLFDELPARVMREQHRQLLLDLFQDDQLVVLRNAPVANVRLCRIEDACNVALCFTQGELNG